MMVHLVVASEKDMVRVLYKATEICHEAGIKHTTIETDVFNGKYHS